MPTTSYFTAVYGSCRRTKEDTLTNARLCQDPVYQSRPEGIAGPGRIDGFHIERGNVESFFWSVDHAAIGPLRKDEEAYT